MRIFNSKFLGFLNFIIYAVSTVRVQYKADKDDYFGVNRRLLTRTGDRNTETLPDDINGRINEYYSK